VGSESDLSELSAEEEKPSKAKKPKKGPVVPIHPDLPNNTAFPDPLEPFERPEGDGTVRIAAWNVAGLKACEKKGKLNRVHLPTILYGTEGYLHPDQRYRFLEIRRS